MNTMSKIVAAVAVSGGVMAAMPADAQGVPGSLTLNQYARIGAPPYNPGQQSVDYVYGETVAANAASTTSLFVANPYSYFLRPGGDEADDLSGTLNILNAGTYTFTLQDDDAGKLVVGGTTLVYSAYTDFSARSASLFLDAGAYSFESFAYQLGGDSFLLGGLSDDSPLGAIFSSDLPTSVPEPTAWGFMLVGVGLMGASIRQRRRVFASA